MIFDGAVRTPAGAWSQSLSRWRRRAAVAVAHAFRRHDPAKRDDPADHNYHDDTGGSTMSTSAAPVGTAAGVDATMTSALKGHFDVTGETSCSDSSKDGISANVGGAVCDVTHTLALQVFTKPTSQQEIEFPAATAIVRVFSVGADRRIKDLWSAGRPASGSEKLTVSARVPRAYEVGADLWKVDANSGIATNNPATSVHTTEGHVSF